MAVDNASEWMDGWYAVVSKLLIKSCLAVDMCGLLGGR